MKPVASVALMFLGGSAILDIGGCWVIKRTGEIERMRARAE